MRPFKSFLWGWCQFTAWFCCRNKTYIPHDVLW
jgi:hypothetical protein